VMNVYSVRPSRAYKAAGSTSTMIALEKRASVIKGLSR
jgi:hypothetical protein